VGLNHLVILNCFRQGKRHQGLGVARFLKIDPEEALRTMVERLARAGGRPLTSMGIEALDALWDQAKATVQPQQPLASGPEL
jgi:hypothetical protein